MARGEISRNPGRGKKIGVFPYDVEQVVGEHVAVRKVEIEAYMQVTYETDSPPPKMVTAVQFYLRCEGEEEWGSDLALCLKAMRGKLDNCYRIHWEPWFLVRVDPQRPYYGEGAGLVLSWDQVYRGVTLDGEVLLRELRVRNGFGSPWVIKPWPVVYQDKTGKAVACVPASKKNEDALQAFAVKRRELNKTLSEFVSPDRIDETLDLIAGGGLRLLG